MSENFMEINEKEDFVEKYDEDLSENSEDSYDGDEGGNGDDSDDESDDSDDEIDSPHKEGSSYMNSAFYLLFNLICIMLGWWLGAKGYGKHLIKNSTNVNLS